VSPREALHERGKIGVVRLEPVCRDGLRQDESGANELHEHQESQRPGNESGEGGESGGHSGIPWCWFGCEAIRNVSWDDARRKVTGAQEHAAQRRDVKRTAAGGSACRKGQPSTVRSFFDSAFQLCVVSGTRFITLRAIQKLQLFEDVRAWRPGGFALPLQAQLDLQCRRSRLVDVRSMEGLGVTA
jgi:hypothetical protein